MNIVRITTIALPLILASSTAFADSEDKKKQGAAEPQPPTEEPAPAPVPQEQPAPPPTYSTTTTTAYSEQAEVVEKHPQSRVTDRLSLEPLMGYGSNSYNFGLGGRIGYTFKVPIYIGGTFMWHHGNTDDFVNASGGLTESRNTFYYPAGELGVDIGIGHNAPLMIRPYGGAGVLLNYSRVSVNNVAATDTSDQFLVYPGITARLNIPKSPAFIGADTRLLIPVVNTDLSWQAFGSIGLSL